VTGVRRTKCLPSCSVSISCRRSSSRSSTPHSGFRRAAGRRSKASLDVTKALAPRQLRKGQTQILIEARKTLDLVFAAITLDTTSKRRQWQMLHDLGKDVMSFRHRALPRDGEVARCVRILARVGIETASNSMFSFVVQYITVSRPTNVGTLVPSDDRSASCRESIWLS
jgi:hypothetical protein